MDEQLQLHGLGPDEPGHEAARGHSGADMTLVEHLLELRNRVLVCAIALVIGIVIAFLLWHQILGWLLAPARESHPDFKANVFSPTESIGVIFKIGLYGGLILATPVFIYEFFAFIVPGLTQRERRMLAPGLIGTVLFLVGGMAFAYWIILPTSLGFLLDVGGDEFNAIINAKEYIDFATRIIFWVGVAFEGPMVMALAARLGLVHARQMLQFWRYAIIVIFIASAVITPTPDPLNQSLVAGPLFGLYFVGIGLARLVQKPRARGGPAPAPA
ncbi:MAG: twin-arginine translocase subunit TatC [Tepidiformaceae bacterium]